MNDQELRRLAEAATPGPWGAPNPDWPEKVMPIYGHGFGGMDPIAWAVWPDFDRRKADAAYIAAVSPDVILGLLDRLAAAGHRTEAEHDCFLMNCKGLGREFEMLREAATAGVL